MNMFSTTNLVDSVVDEIALEGLDGITLEALWDRLAIRFHEKVPLSRSLMEQVWNICLQVRELSFYELETPRAKLVIFDRYEFVDPDLGIILEPENIPDDIYTHRVVDDPIEGVKGSCASYRTRRDISDSIKNSSLQKVDEKYGRRLVVVASQAERRKSLMDKTVCPALDLTPMQYCFLERVGRARYHGEVTQGKLSLSLLNEDPKSLFYHRKFLLRHKLVVKQMHHQKSGGHSCGGSLLHLPRFYVERKPKVIYLAEKVIEILKSRENRAAEYSEIKKELRVESSVKKLFKSSFFQKVVRTDLLVPYRALYPDAENVEWRTKNNPSKEKILRVVRLVDDNIDINDIWNKEETTIEDDDPFELDVSEQKLNVSFLRQANVVVEAAKYEGAGQSELAKLMGLPKLQSRTIFRNLARRNVVATYMNDMGRQRVTKYVSRKFENSSGMSERFKREMYKMKKFTETRPEKIKRDERETGDAISNGSSFVKLHEENVSPGRDDRASGVAREEIEKKKKSVKISRGFRVAAKILKKYKITGCAGNYRRTFRNIGGTRRDGDGERRKSTVIDVKDDGVEDDDEEDDDQDVSMSLTNDVGDKKNVSNVTYRLLKRANIIIETVKEHKVIDDMTKLIRVISEEEEREGYDVKIDKKSLIRLLQRLAKDNLVKNIKLTLSANGKQKTLTFICDPSIDVDHTVIRSAVEQAKIKFCLIDEDKAKTATAVMVQATPKRLESTCENSTEASKKSTEKEENVKSNDKILPINLIFDRKAGRRYGYSPKFVRMQTLHAFLFYLIYQHPGRPVVNSHQEKIFQIFRDKGFDTIEESASIVYSTEMDWKMFVPPLPNHQGWPLGWALMCDILLRMPLSIFLKVHKVSYAIAELDEYIEDPVRRHILVKDLPPSIRNVLLIQRKYIFSVHEVVTRLCYVGLLQFGPQKLKEKDKVFIYLNRNTRLLDTTSSAAHYHKIENKSYPVVKFFFDSGETIDKYWYKLWTICINTHLGGRLVVEGKDIVLEDLAKKNEMIEATRARTPEEASILDVSGIVPGDRKGAAGIDSAFFAHLKRNWNWESSNFPFQRVSSVAVANFDATGATTHEGRREAHLSRVKPKPLKFTDFHGLKRTSGPTTLDAGDLRKKRKKTTNDSPVVARSNLHGVSDKKTGKKCSQQNRVNVCKNNLTASTGSGRNKSYVRRVLPRKSRIRPRVKYDDIDYSALRRMDKLRVDWDNKEDNILLVCKVAMMYLCPNPRRQLITFTAVRDVLRSYSTTSDNKTSRACQRRLLYMLKKPQTLNSVNLGVEELKQNFYVNRRFADTVDRLKKEYTNPYKYDQRVASIFRDLVAYIAKKHYDMTDIVESTSGSGNLVVAPIVEDPTPPTPTTIEEFNLIRKIKYPTKSTNIDKFHEETSNDVHSSTINSVIHSSMCCGKDRRSWAYQLFRIYQQYPEWLLRTSMAKIRADRMISIKKHYVFAMRKNVNACMPMSSSQYQLSSGYLQKFNTKIPFDVFKESYDFYDKLARHDSDYVENDRRLGDGMENSPMTGGTVVAVHDYMNLDRLNFDLEIPRHVIMLDPTLEKDDERYIRIAKRYQDILRNLEHFRIEDFRIGCGDRIDKSDEESSTLKEMDGSTKDEKKVFFDGSTTESLDGKEIVRARELENEREIFENDRDLGLGRNDDVVPEDNDNDQDFNLVVDDDDDNNVDDEDDDDYDDEDENEDDFREQDDLISFLDGTKIRLTARDIENSGIKKEIPDRLEFCRVDKCLENNEEMEIDEEMETDEEMEFSLKLDETTNEDEEIDRSNRVNDIIERSKKLRNDRDPYFRTAEANDIHKRYTRIALLKMREELNDLTPNDSHHAHEYFVLNMFKIFYSLDRSRMNDKTELPLKKDVCNRVIADLKKFAIFPNNRVSYRNFKRQIGSSSEIFDRSFDAVYQFIRDKGQLGATLTQLATKFYNIFGEKLYEILSLLKENRLVLRSGIKNTRYVHKKFADPWLIHSYKIMRLQRESQQNVPGGSLYVTSEEPNEKKSNVTNDADVEDGEDEEEEGKKNQTENESTNSSQRKVEKSRTCLLQTKDIYRAAKQLDLDTAEEIRVVVRPWIRIDGALNRRVLDRMLGSVLAYSLIHPGTYLTKIQEKFSPALQPFHTKELVEILVTLECLKIGSARKSNVTLFSKSSSTKPVFSSVPDRSEWGEEQLIIEPVLGATLKFSIFLSNRNYSSDFLA